MMGYDISWAAFNMIEVMSSTKFTYKVWPSINMCKWLYGACMYVCIMYVHVSHGFKFHHSMNARR